VDRGVFRGLEEFVGIVELTLPWWLRVFVEIVILVCQPGDTLGREFLFVYWRKAFFETFKVWWLET
jgi:hypothetical protein